VVGFVVKIQTEVKNRVWKNSNRFGSFSS